jgi:hypothetical protein
MKLHKGWIITTTSGDEFVVLVSDFGTIRWAKRYGYDIQRTFILR